MRIAKKYNGPYIDPHVHTRDEAQAYKATIRQVFDLAKAQGIVAICEMPNTANPITTSLRVNERVRLAESEGVKDGHYIIIGATNDRFQLMEAFSVASNHPKVVAVKMYAGVSVGSLNLSDIEDQKLVYKVAAEMDYRGVICLHCEEESLAQPQKWNPKEPRTWNLAKPPEMEIMGVQNQIRFARDAGYRGGLHICHTSTPEAVEIVNDASRMIRITCAVTPHHLLFSTPNSLSKKVNPPIRDEKMMLALRTLVREGKVDVIETDHAPHTEEEKMGDKHMSGIPSLIYYHKCLDLLRAEGISEKLIKSMTYTRIKEIFPKIKE